MVFKKEENFVKPQKWLIVLGLVLLANISMNAQIAGYKNFEIVESYPTGTEMDHPDVRNAHDVWLEMINSAKVTLDIEQFYISSEPNEPLEDIINAIQQAANRGVKVRIIADAGMYKTYPQTLDALGKQKNISVSLIDYRKISDGIQHAKFFIADGEQVYLGSQNFDWRALKHIYELGVRILDKRAAKTFSDVFTLDWKLSKSDGKKNLIHKEQYKTPYILTENGDTLKYFPTFSPTGYIPNENLWDEKQLLRLIDNAKTEIYFHVLTYSPVAKRKEYYEVLDNALRRAALRGVKVHVMCADWSKRKPTIDFLKSLTVVPNIEVKLSTIPEWSGGFVPYARVDHSKFLIVDDNLSWIGTSNWEKSYFYNARNVGVVVESKPINKILRKIYLSNWDGPYSYLLKPEIEYAPPRVGE
jgi:phosphatidylserine/phosphatidylglycerophosphate/cardiolipin synthase-like enzyme